MEPRPTPPDQRPAPSVVGSPAGSSAAANVAAAPPRDPSARTADLILAGVHLRLGSLALARAELEALAGRDALDEEGLVDLAEARWRTGDMAGAGEAATAALDGDRGPVIALVIAAEAAAARGRPTDARRLAALALTGAGETIDRIFAGMPRSSVWPTDPAAPAPSPTTMFPTPTSARRAAAGRAAADRAAGRTGRVEPAAADEADVRVPVEAIAMTPGLWDLGHVTDGVAEDADDLPSGDDELARGRAALDVADTHAAAIHFALVLRVAPMLAPAVIDLLAERPERELAVVRGDAYRLVGRELEARRAFSDAARPPVRPTLLDGSTAEAPGVPDATVDRPSEPPSDRQQGDHA